MKLFGALAVFGLAVAHVAALPAAHAVTETMSVAAQNAIVQKYCVSCHAGAKRAGGLSLERFDAAHVAPSLAAMMLSKVRSGAMGASAIPMPDKATIDAFAAALAVEAKGSENWTIESNGAITSASVLRQVAAPSKPGGASLYRLALTCDASKGLGEMQLAWSPLPVKATLVVELGTKSFTYNVDGADFHGLPTLVSDEIVFSGLFPNEKIEFSFGDLPRPARRALSPCFKD